MGGPAAPPSAARFGARAVLAAAAVAGAGVLFGLVLFLVQDHWDPLLDVDAGARDAMHTYAVAHHAFVTFLLDLSVAASAVGYVPLFVLVCVWLGRQRLWRLVAFVAVTWLGSVLLNAAVKALVGRARPVLVDPVTHANGLSFPSGHAQSAVVSVGVLWLVFVPVLPARARIAAFVAGAVWILAIGFARVSLGVHYVSDVLGGYALGAAWLIAMAWAFNAWRQDRGHRAVSAASEGLEPEHEQRLRGGDA